MTTQVPASMTAEGVTAAQITALQAVDTALQNRAAVLEAKSIFNRIINSAMKVDQRNAGAAQTFTAAAALAYCMDRWYGYCTGANITGQRITVSGQNRYQFTGAASNTGVGFGQRIEAANSMDLAGQTATLQVKLSSSSLTAITWTAYYATTTDTFGTLASPTRTQIATGSFTITSTEATYSTPISLPAAAITGVEIVFTGGALLASQTLTIGDVQLEPGAVLTAFTPRLYGQELELCQRYYETAVGEKRWLYTGGVGLFGNSVQFKVTKRAAPIMATANVVYSNANTIVIETAAVWGFTCYASSAGAGGAVLAFDWTATAEL